MATAKKTRKSVPLSVRVRLYMAKNPKATAKQVADAVGTTLSYVYVIKSELNKKKEAEALPVDGIGVAYDLKEKKWQAVAPITLSAPIKADSVNHPAHYKVGGIETIDFIEAKQLSYHLGNVVKYITRADHKGNELEDLHKARWYLNREIARREGAK